MPRFCVVHFDRRSRYLPLYTLMTFRSRRVKKPSIAIVAGASTSEDVCPWEAAPPEPRSRKNSAQMDSGSSSSDISVAVAEVAEKVMFCLDSIRVRIGFTGKFYFTCGKTFFGHSFPFSSYR